MKFDAHKITVVNCLFTARGGGVLAVKTKTKKIAFSHDKINCLANGAEINTLEAKKNTFFLYFLYPSIHIHTLIIIFLK